MSPEGPPTHGAELAGPVRIMGSWRWMARSPDRHVSVGNEDGRATITFPVHCRYLGGHRALGGRGRHLWIRTGRIGYGALRLTRSIPMTEVTSVEVSEREIGGANRRVIDAVGVLTRTAAISHPPKQLTDIVVRTKDGQEAAWEVNRRGEVWVRDKLRAALDANGVLIYDELRPDQRVHRPGAG